MYKCKMSELLNLSLKAEIAARSAQADQLIASLTAQIEEIKQQAPLPAQIQETILKQENAQLRWAILNAEILTQLARRQNYKIAQIKN